MRSTAGGRWRRSWELGTTPSSHGSVIHQPTPAPLNGDVTHTTATRRKAPIRRARVCVPPHASVRLMPARCVRARPLFVEFSVKTGRRARANARVLSARCPCRTRLIGTHYISPAPFLSQSFPADAPRVHVAP
ncbi:unnamed protein product, partial [Iphiclides podalirius]